jgi:hypothetical protein
MYSDCAVQIKPTITFDQYIATIKAVTSAKPKAVRTYPWWHYAILALICIVFGLGPGFSATRVPALTVCVVMVLYWVASKPLTSWSQNQHYRRVYAQEQALLNDQVLTIDESGIVCDLSKGKGTIRYTWQLFVSCIDLADAYLFLQTPNSFVRVPKETLTQTDKENIEVWSASIRRIAR